MNFFTVARSIDVEIKTGRLCYLLLMGPQITGQQRVSEIDNPRKSFSQGGGKILEGHP